MSDRLEIEHRHLRSAIEFAVAMADELGKRKRSIAVPRDLRAQASGVRIPTGALGRLRRSIEADDEFRTVIAAGAIPELVDPIGILWLQRPDGWQQEVARLSAAASAEAEEHDLRTTLRREEKRRLAAEQATLRSRAEVVSRQATIDRLEQDVEILRADLVKADDAIAELRAELVDVRTEARHARDRHHAERGRLQAEVAALRDTADAAPVAAPEGAGTPMTDPAPPMPPAIDVGELTDIVQAAREVAARAEALLAADLTPSTTGPRRERRRPLAMPGGVISTSAEAAEYLLRSDAAVLVDGYNVAKLAWPSRPLEAQRRQLLDALENAARRFGTDITVVFDGAAVVGAHTTRRRLLRVVYSPEGVIADDVIRDEVRRLPTSRPVVVVTNDAEIVDDVRALGANVVPSNALIAVL